MQVVWQELYVHVSWKSRRLVTAGALLAKSVKIFFQKLYVKDGAAEHKKWSWSISNCIRMAVPLLTVTNTHYLLYCNKLLFKAQPVRSIEECGEQEKGTRTDCQQTAILWGRCSVQVEGLWQGRPISPLSCLKHVLQPLTTDAFPENTSIITYYAPWTQKYYILLY